MKSSELNPLGAAFGGYVMVSVLADTLGADVTKIKRQATRYGLLRNIGGVPYINGQKFLEKQEEDEGIRKERKRIRASAKKPESLSTTNNIGILRGQKTRLTNLNRELDQRIAMLDKKIVSAKDKQEKSNLETDRGRFEERLDSNKATLQVAIDRLAILEQSDSQDSPDSEK